MLRRAVAQVPFQISRSVAYRTRTPRLFGQASISQLRFYARNRNENPNSFTNIFKQVLQQELHGNEDLQKKIKELKNTGTASSAKTLSEKTKEITGNLMEAAEPIVQSFKNSVENVSEVAEKVAQSTPVQAVASTVQKAAESIAEQPIVKRVVDEVTYEERERRKLFYFFRSSYARQQDKKQGIYFNPYTNRMEKEGEQTVNTTTTAVATEFRRNIRPKTRFDRIKDKFANAASQLDGSGNPIVSATKSIITGAGTVIGSVGNTVFKPNEQSEALSVIKQNDPEFALDKFLNSVQYNVIPDMMKAYFTDDMETVKRYVTDSCWKSYFYPLMEARRQMNYRFDSKVLDITDVELSTSRFLQDEPILVIQSQVQYIFCVRDGKGTVIEGGPNTIRLEGQLWLFQQDPTGETKDWELAEVVFSSNIRL